MNFYLLLLTVQEQGDIQWNTKTINQSTWKNKYFQATSENSNLEM